MPRKSLLTPLVARRLAGACRKRTRPLAPSRLVLTLAVRARPRRIRPPRRASPRRGRRRFRRPRPADTLIRRQLYPPSGRVLAEVADRDRFAEPARARRGDAAPRSRPGAWRRGDDARGRIAASNRSATRSSSPSTASERSRLPVPMAWEMPTPLRSRSHRELLDAGAGGPDDADRAALDAVREAEADAGEDRGAAVGPHHEQAGRAPARLSATSSARATLSEKRKTFRPASSARCATKAAYGPGTATETRFAAGCSLTASAMLAARAWPRPFPRRRFGAADEPRHQAILRGRERATVFAGERDDHVERRRRLEVGARESRLREEIQVGGGSHHRVGRDDVRHCAEIAGNAHQPRRVVVGSAANDDTMHRGSLSSTGPEGPASTAGLKPRPTPLPIPRTPLPIPRTPLPIPRTPLPIPRTPLPIPRTPLPIPRTPLPIPCRRARAPRRRRAGRRPSGRRSPPIASTSRTSAAVIRAWIAEHRRRTPQAAPESGRPWPRQQVLCDIGRQPRRHGRDREGEGVRGSWPNQAQAGARHEMPCPRRCRKATTGRESATSRSSPVGVNPGPRPTSAAASSR